MLELTWDCPYCGLATPEPASHLRRAHHLSIEELMARRESQERREREFERLLMLDELRW